MKLFSLLFLVFLLAGCGIQTHIVKKTYLSPNMSENWSISERLKNSGEFRAAYSCGTQRFIFRRSILENRNLTTSIFWLAIIPTFSRDTVSKRNLEIEINYTNKSTSCLQSDLMLIHKSNSIAAGSVHEFRLDDSHTMCRYSWPITYEEVMEVKLKFNVIGGCEVPELNILKLEELSYENHFTSW